LNRVPAAKHLGIDIEGFGWDDQRGREWVPYGFQMTKPRRPHKAIPEWVLDTAHCRRVVENHPQFPVLGETWRKIIYWHYQLQWSSQEIADQLDLSLNSVKSTLKRLNQRARKFDMKVASREQEVAQATSLYIQGFSVRDVSRALGVSVGKAWRLRVHFNGLRSNPICEAAISDDFPQAQLSPPLESILPELHV
jgi:transposase